MCNRRPRFLQAGFVHSSWAGQPAPLRAGPRLSSEPGFPTGTWPWWWFCLWPLAPPPHLERFAYLSQVPKPVPAAALPGVLAACLCRCSWEGSEEVPAGTGGTQLPGSSPSERRWEAAGASRGGKQGGMSTAGGGAGPGALRGLLRVWSCSMLSSCFDLEQLATGRWARHT